MRLPVCTYCRHANEDTCRAYPDGIPWRILSGDQDHRTVQPDQVGSTTFEQDPKLNYQPDRSRWDGMEAETTEEDLDTDEG